MDRAQIDSEHFVARYLRGELAQSEEEAFEAYCQEHPQMYREIEANLRLREGLCALQDRRELTQLASEPTRSYRPWALAAALAGCALLLVSMGRFFSADSQRGVPAAAESAALSQFLPTRTRIPLPVAAAYSLVRSREDAAETVISLPSTAAAIEVRILPSEFDADARYRITLQPQVTGGKESSVEGLPPGPDRYVVVYLDSRQLRPGEYRLLLAPSAGNTTSRDTTAFMLHLK